MKERLLEMYKEASQLKREASDVGTKHNLLFIQEEIKTILDRMGYDIVSHPRKQVLELVERGVEI